MYQLWRPHSLAAQVFQVPVSCYLTFGSSSAQQMFVSALLGPGKAEMNQTVSVVQVSEGRLMRKKQVIQGAGSLRCTEKGSSKKGWDSALQWLPPTLSASHGTDAV